MKNVIDTIQVNSHKNIINELISHGDLGAVRNLINRKHEALDWSGQSWIQDLIRKWKEGAIALDADEVIDIILLMVEKKIGISYKGNPMGSSTKTCPVDFIGSLSRQSSKDDVLVRLIQAFSSISKQFPTISISDVDSVLVHVAEMDIETERDARRMAHVMEYLRKEDNDHFRFFFALLFGNDLTPELMAKLITECQKVSGRTPEENLNIFDRDVELTPERGRSKKNHFNYVTAKGCMELFIELSKTTNIQASTHSPKKNPI